MALSFSGNLIETPFSDVIAVLRQQKATGTLTCGTGTDEKSLYVKNGHIIFATSKDERDRLGEIMVKDDMITRGQLERALKIHQHSAGLKKIGAIFVENGFVSPKDLFNGVKMQVRGIIHSLFLLTDGPYNFEERLPADVIPLQINMEELLREVLQQMKQGMK
jgi:hypothetical protein